MAGDKAAKRMEGQNRLEKKREKDELTSNHDSRRKKDARRGEKKHKKKDKNTLTGHADYSEFDSSMDNKIDKIVKTSHAKKRKYSPYASGDVDQRSSHENSEMTIPSKKPKKKKSLTGFPVDDETETQKVDNKVMKKKHDKKKPSRLSKEKNFEPLSGKDRGENEEMTKVKSKKKRSKDKSDASGISKELQESCGENGEATKVKSKKKRSKHNSDDGSNKELEENVTSGHGSKLQAAVEYVRRWQNDRDNWKFQKKNQVALLANMYEEKKVSNSDFEILLAYLSGMRGMAREKTLELAEQKVRLAETKEIELSEEELGRRRRIIQLLS